MNTKLILWDTGHEGVSCVRMNADQYARIFQVMEGDKSR